MDMFSRDEVARIFSRHVPLYAWRAPVYQHVALDSLRQIWDGGHRRALDVGGGTGIVAHAIRLLFALEEVVSVDVEDRFLPGLDIETAVYDGVTLPFGDGSFDCVVMFNMLHHVPPMARAALLRECRRVAPSGPVYIKDHLSAGRLDDLRLTGLDLMGNLPFYGMVQANYLRAEDWGALASETGYVEGAYRSGNYRSGIAAAVFPNRLEMTTRWRPR